jgi:hypothetical protein
MKFEQSYRHLKEMIQRYKMPDGSSLYWMTSDHYVAMGDESSIHTIIYSANRPNDEKKMDDHDKLDDILTTEISDYGVPSINGLLYEDTNEFNDTIRIQITDHSIYLILINSGQY